VHFIQQLSGLACAFHPALGEQQLPSAHFQESDMSIESIVDFSEATTAAERFTPAAEKILKGEPNQTVYNHYNSPCGQLNAGVWEGEVGQWKVNYTEHEYCEIVQGVSVLVTKTASRKPCARVIAS
jgi:uncharacterized cupin superfamily protein